MQKAYKIEFLEWMITTSCNLACPGCDRFIEFSHNWTEPYDSVVERMKQWSRIVQPENLTLIGGEPLIHPRIYDIIKTARHYFPKTTIEIATNGLLLGKKPYLKKVMLETGNCKINLSLHNNDSKVQNKIFELVDKHLLDKKWKQIDSNYWQRKSIVVDIMEVDDWFDYRRNIDGKLKPWTDGDASASYNACGVSIFPIVYNGVMYKCPPISMLRTHLKKFNRLDDVDWQPYLNYLGITPQSSGKEIKKFIKNITQPHWICEMCPANPMMVPQKEAFIKHSLDNL
jgi:MoaA/NifB/PqqE/SkfB family radical SAM enzyme